MCNSPKTKHFSFTFSRRTVAGTVDPQVLPDHAGHSQQSPHGRSQVHHRVLRVQRHPAAPDEREEASHVASRLQAAVPSKFVREKNVYWSVQNFHHFLQAIRSSCLGGICEVFRHDCSKNSSPINQHLRDDGERPEGERTIVYADENSLYGSSVSLVNALLLICSSLDHRLLHHGSGRDISSASCHGSLRIVMACAEASSSLSVKRYPVSPLVLRQHQASRLKKP